MFKIIEETYAWKPGASFKLQTPDTIVIHHALSPDCTAQDVHRWHLADGHKGILYHLFLPKKGTSAYRGRQEQHKGGHVMGSENDNTIGICLEGCYTDYAVNGKVLTEKEVPAEQLELLVWTCQDLMSRWPITKIKGHFEYPSAQKEGKDCPGKYFPWDKFWQMLKRAENKRIIQTQVRFSNPKGVWDTVEENHPFPDALYQQWANSYKILG